PGEGRKFQILSPGAYAPRLAGKICCLCKRSKNGALALENRTDRVDSLIPSRAGQEVGSCPDGGSNSEKVSCQTLSVPCNSLVVRRAASSRPIQAMCQCTRYKAAGIARANA